MRAFIRNVESGSVDQGVSTITQQLIKIGVLSADHDLLERKVPEAALAIQSGKLPRKAGLTLVRGAEQYDLTLQAETFAISGAKISQLRYNVISENPTGSSAVCGSSRAAR